MLARRKVLFLDFDGVLHPSFAQTEEFFCRLPLLEAALAGASCDIVLSTSWRFHRDLPGLLKPFSLPVRRMIVGRTGEAFIGPHARFREIVDYLGSFGHADWRALDDSRFEFPPECPQLIACDARIGLSDSEAQEIRSWLRSSQPVDAPSSL